jgi:hypothetical protein
MKIAILAWGSLIWDPRNLKIDKSQGNNGWFNDGPMLPIEFARISQDGRLTLVIVPGKTSIQTSFAISKYQEIDHTILDLAVREGCGKNSIGYFDRVENIFQSKFLIREAIAHWLEGKNGINAVIWTDLSRNFKDKLDKELTPENAVCYLNSLSPDIRAKAEEYIRKASSNLRTPIRNSIEIELGWRPISKLSDD